MNHRKFLQGKSVEILKGIDFDLEQSILNLNRQFLHAKTIGFEHPRTGKNLIYSSKLPDELENILKKLRKACK